MEYSDFRKLFTAANDHLRGTQLQNAYIAKWNSIKRDANAKQAEFDALKSKVRQRKSKLNDIWSNANLSRRLLFPQQPASTTTTEPATATEPSLECTAAEPSSKTKSRPVLDGKRKRLEVVRDSIVKLDAVLSISIGSEEMKAKRHAFEKERQELEKNITDLKRNAIYVKRAREKKRTAEAAGEPVAKERRTSGRPPIESSMQSLHDTILFIVNGGNVMAQEKRQDESVRTARTLDELNDELRKKGLLMSRSATYLRLMPRNSATTEGKACTSFTSIKLSIITR